MRFPFSLGELGESFLKNDTLSIDIGYTNIKLVHVRKKSGKLKVINFVIGETPGNCLRNGVISDLDSIAASLRKVMTERNINEKNVKIVISAGSNIISRLIFVPAVEQKAVEALIGDELKNQMPVNMLEQRIFYRIIGQTEYFGKFGSKVLATLVPNSVIDNYVRLVKLLNLKPLSIEIPFTSVARFFGRGIEVTEKNKLQYGKVPTGNTDGCTLVVDLGSETTNMSILTDGALEFNRIILAGGRNLDEVISSKLGIANKEAEILKKKYGISTGGSTVNKDEQTVDQCARYYLGEIFDNIKRSMEFYTEKYGGARAERVVLIGGGSGMIGIREFAEHIIKLPVFTVDMMSFGYIEFGEKLGSDKIRFLINAIGISM